MTPPHDGDLELALHKLHKENADLNAQLGGLQAVLGDLQQRAEACYYLPHKPGYLMAKRDFEMLCSSTVDGERDSQRHA